MNDPLLPERPRNLLNDLRQLVAERAPAEVEIPQRFSSNRDSEQKRHEAERDEFVRRYQQEKGSAESEYAATRRAIVARYQQKYAAMEREYDEVRHEIAMEFKTGGVTAKKKMEETRWEATTLFEATKDGPPTRLKETQDQVAARTAELQAIGEQAVATLKRRWQWREYPQPEAARPPAEGDPMPRFVELADRAQSQYQALRGLTVPGFFEGAQPLGFFVLFWLLLIYPAILLFGLDSWHWIGASAGTAALVWVVLGVWLYRIARRQSIEGYVALQQTLADADAAARRLLEAAGKTCERESAAILQRMKSDLKRAEDRFKSVTKEITYRRDTGLKEVEEKYPPALTDLTVRREAELDRVEDRYKTQMHKIEGAFATGRERLDREHAERMEGIEQDYHRQWNEMAERWREGMAAVQSGVTELIAASSRVFLDWNSSDGSQWQPSTETPRAVPFGRLGVSLGAMEGGLPGDERLAPEVEEFSLPALVPFPDQTLMFKAAGEGRDRAIEAIQATMLRMLTAMPPGKVRFTIIDPVGLGENFSAFMHLADFDEQLVASRIWTEAGHIEQRLADLTEHMETVIQVYLRNEFQTIQQYNDFAGEMAEPYRVLVVANFPAAFSEAAARRLVSIVSSGARCGVHTLLSVDTKQKLPHNFHLSDLEPNALSLRWQEGRFIWDDPDYRDLPLEIDRPPEAERFTQIIRTIGGKVRDADRVEVPFECVVPDDGSWWTRDTRRGIDVALGRAGAKKLQHLALGKGTSQHVLISGKTGSGKSNLLHAVVTTAALWYSPDEVELYLIDFKKGVEFKAYAARELPHVRVVAIESEREFGLSVLQRLDLELRHRGDRFRTLGVQDLPGLRAAEPDAVLPRVLLIIDEFQELFVEDDRIAQDAALLLDRLVRQGRAFGIHVILGSQTLAGSYSLPRATIGQMAVRIALQCSEADAHLILSEENSAARLLTRPGEAIYNDANGLIEGNHPFQVVWLPDHVRDRYLDRVAELVGKREIRFEPPIVFEGNAPAEVGRNPLLRRLLEGPSWPARTPSPQVWLGAAVAIKDPTAVELPRQGGSNLLVVGHREEAALGILSSCMVSLAAQVPPRSADDNGDLATFYVLDGSRPDSPEAGFWQTLVPVLPHAVKIGGPRDAAELIGELAAEVSRRQEAGDEDAPPVYLLIYNLSRFRDLRKEEDSFGFSSFDEDKPPSPGKQFAEIVREGPAFGVHTLLWCDTYNNLLRAVDRQGMRELELRVVFQMSDVDSSNLIDSPEAGRIGIHRAILFNEGLGDLEKFRPYGRPSADWLEWVRQRLHGRSADPTMALPDQV